MTVSLSGQTLCARGSGAQVPESRHKPKPLFPIQDRLTVMMRLAPAPMRTLVHIRDHAARGLFERGGNDRMYQRANPGSKQPECKSAGKAGMFCIALVNAMRMVKEYAFHHGLFSCFRDQGQITRRRL